VISKPVSRKNVKAGIEFAAAWTATLPPLFNIDISSWVKPFVKVVLKVLDYALQPRIYRRGHWA
jgi:hypothetical protein